MLKYPFTSSLKPQRIRKGSSSDKQKRLPAYAKSLVYHIDTLAPSDKRRYDDASHCHIGE